MKTLLLMRHAKASPSATGMADFDRPLVDEGRVAARRIGKSLKGEIQVDAALSSTAARTRETIETVLQSAAMPIDTRYDQRIYDGGPLCVVEVISEIDNDSNAVLLVGHNPALEDLLQVLTGEDVHLSPGTLAKIDLEVNEWSEVGPGSGVIDKILRPKELED